MKIKFHSRREVQDEFRGTDKATVFDAGKEYELPDASASRWVQRGLASVVAATKEHETAKPQTQTGRLGPQVKA